MKIKIEKLSLYPIKSCGGMDVSEFILGEQGPQIQKNGKWIGDRQWMWVDSFGKFISQREIPELSLCHPEIDGKDFYLKFPQGKVQIFAAEKRKDVQVWSHQVSAGVCEISDSKWLQQYLGKEVHLVEFDSSSKREAMRKGESLGVQTRFTDSQPYLLLSQESLKDLNARMITPIPMSRFRGNIEVSGAPAFAEDRWQSLAKGDLELKTSKACGRCVMININQENQGSQVEKNPEALKTLAQFRKQEKSVLFGRYFHTFSFGQILKVGDELEIKL